jgi:hypothetical protein
MWGATGRFRLLQMSRQTWQAGGGGTRADESEANGQLSNPLPPGLLTVINIAAVIRMLPAWKG